MYFYCRDEDALLVQLSLMAISAMPLLAGMHNDVTPFYNPSNLSLFYLFLIKHAHSSSALEKR